MKPNLFKEKLARGQMPVGHMLVQFNTRGMAKMLEAAGVDFAMIDMEHGSFNIAEFADMVAWLKATPVTPFVRVAGPDYHLIARVLDVGAQGVMVPNVRSSAEARAIVEAARYPPAGRRGLHFGGESSDFLAVDGVDHVREANENITVICMIESPEGVEDLDGIAGTPGVDALWVGHWDLTNFMGIPGAFHDPRFLGAVSRVVNAAHRHGLAAAIQPASTEQLCDFLALGFDAISYGSDFNLYQEALTRGVAAVRDQAGARLSVAR